MLNRWKEYDCTYVRGNYSALSEAEAWDSTEKIATWSFMLRYIVDFLFLLFNTVSTLAICIVINFKSQLLIKQNQKQALFYSAAKSDFQQQV